MSLTSRSFVLRVLILLGTRKCALRKRRNRLPAYRWLGLRTYLGLWKPTLDLREWNTLVSAQTAPREVFRRLPDGSYEVFEEVIGRQSSHSFWVSSTVTKWADLTVQRRACRNEGHGTQK
jgi:hypothetical protein